MSIVAGFKAGPSATVVESCVIWIISRNVSSVDHALYQALAIEGAQTTTVAGTWCLGLVVAGGSGLKVRIGQNLHSRIVGTFKLIQSTTVEYRRMIRLPNRSRTY